MKPRFPLSTKILLVAGANLALLALVGLVFAQMQFGFRFDALLMGPAHERVVSLARQAALDLGDTAEDGREELIERYAKAYGVTFYLFRDRGEQVAGPKVNFPAPVLEELRRPPAPAEPPPPEHGERGRGEDKKGFEDGPPPPAAEREREFKRGERPFKKGGRKAFGPERQPPIFQLAADGLYWVGAGIPLRAAGDERQRPGLILMSAPSFAGTPLFFDYQPFLWLILAVVAVSALCWLPFIRGLTKTIGDVSRATERIAEGRFGEKLPEDRRDELGLLAGGINHMAARLTGFVQGQKRFLGDIAHELCAPIARIQFALGILEHKTGPGAVDDLQEEVRQMSTLVNELLSFSKSGMEEKRKPLVAVKVAEAARQAVARENAVVGVDVPAELQALADGDALVRALGNLVRNAVRYAGDAGPIGITARAERGAVVVAVQDAGPGLPEAEVDRVFEPFYRVETSRNRAHGGVGLGLAIVRSCVEACGGTVRCRNRVPTGLEVEIRLQGV